MTASGSHIRSLSKTEEALQQTEIEIQNLSEETILFTPKELGAAFKNYSLLITQFVYLKAIKNYIEVGGSSRGSYLF